MLGPKHPDTLRTRNNLAAIYQSAGRLDQAIALYEQTLADSRQELGVDHPDVFKSQSNLAGAYADAGRIDEAISLYEQTLADGEQVLTLMTS